MTRSIHLNVVTAVSIFCLFASGRVHATPLILNGGFESGFSSWTRVNQLGSEGTFFLQSGALSPVNGDPVPLPPGGTFAAMTDAFGPGSHVLYQDFIVPAESALLSFSLFIGNRADRFATPASLDFSTPTLNQQARVDLLRAGVDPFTVASPDVLLNLYQTHVGDPLISGYNAVNFDLTSLFSANVGQTLRLRFAETDNIFTFQFGVDNVSLETSQTSAVPEPSSLLLLGIGLAGLLAIGRRQLLGGL